MRRRRPRAMLHVPLPRVSYFYLSAGARCSLACRPGTKVSFSYRLRCSTASSYGLPGSSCFILLKPLSPPCPLGGSSHQLTMSDSASSASYIRMVHHLIEKCICFNLNREECMDALEKHANINPVITSTVWKELEKENKEFFETYNKDRVERNIEEETMQRIQRMLSEAAASKTDDEEEG